MSDVDEFVLDQRELAIEVRVQPGKDEINGYQNELDAYFAVMKILINMESSEVLQHLSSFSARVSEIRSVLQRTDSRRNTTFRTKEIDPFLEECDRQFKIHSRLISLREQDWKIAGGQYG